MSGSLREALMELAGSRPRRDDEGVLVDPRQLDRLDQTLQTLTTYLAEWDRERDDRAGGSPRRRALDRLSPEHLVQLSESFMVFAVIESCLVTLLIALIIMHGL